MAAADRLSALPDDVLQRVLSFAPVREAAASAVLSRRWRTLWSRTSAVNLDSRPYTKAQKDRRCYSPTFRAFFRDAQAAIGRRRRGGTGLKRLTLFLERDAYNSGYSKRTRGAEPEQDGRVVVAGLLADPAVARLEELSIDIEDEYYDQKYNPPLASLSCGATLRVLHLHLCSIQPTSSSAGLAFPSLMNLTLDGCFFSAGYLQVMVDAATALTTLALVNISEKSTEPGCGFSTRSYISLPLSLRCPTATALVLVHTNAGEKELKACAADGGSGIELDMPSLRSFRYYGYPIKLSLTSPAPELQRVDLDVTHRYTNGSWDLKYEPPPRILASFSTTRALKLRLNFIEGIVADEYGWSYGVVLPTFPNLELLELDAGFQYMGGNTVVATATLLRSFVAMSELRLRLGMQSNYYHDRMYNNPVGGPFAQSVERFERLAAMSPGHRAAVQLDGVSDLPDVLTNNNCAFRCLQKSLRKVTLQFKSKEVNCFQVQLAKFLVENAMVLEEMHIDDGCQFLPDHLLDKVERWRAAAFRKRNLQSDTAAGLRVYQLAVADSEIGESVG